MMSKWHTFEVVETPDILNWINEEHRARVKAPKRNGYIVVRMRSDLDAVEFRLKFSDEITEGEQAAINNFMDYSISRQIKNTPWNFDYK
jgi:hypothetical protein